MMKTRPFPPLPYALHALIAVLSFPATLLFSLEIHEYEQARHDRFDTGTFPGAPAGNDGLWVGEFDFSGVGWSDGDPRKAFALISPRHFVGANHFRPSTGSEIKFVGADGEVRGYTYERFHNIKNDDDENTDLFIGELAEDIPEAHGIAFYPVLEKPESELEGMEILVYGRGHDEPRIGRGEIGGFGDSFGTLPLTEGPLNDTRHYTFDYRENSAGPDDAHFELGDSGSPSFIVYEGDLTVSGIHSALEENSVPVEDRFTSYDSFILHYKDQVNAHMEATGHELTLAPRPEEDDDEEPDEDPGDDLKITGIDLEGATVTLAVRNSLEEPYDVQRTTDLNEQEWETVATGQTGETWTGTAPDGTAGVFWRLVR